MNREQLILGTLLSLFDLAHDLGHSQSVRVNRVAGRIGASPDAVRAALVHLEGKELVDAERVRLTLRGLAIATAFRASESVTLRAAA